MEPRRVLDGILQLVIIVLLVVLAAGVASAHGAASPNVDPSFPHLTVEAADPGVQALSNQACRHLRRAGFPVPCPRVYLAKNLDEGVAAAASPLGTLVTPEFNVDPRGAGRWLCPRVELHVHVHELLHRLQATRVAYVTAQGQPIPMPWLWADRDVWWEEAAVEAVTLDVMPGVVRRLCSDAQLDNGHFEAYPRQVAAFRAASARAVRAGWRTTAARSWRAWFVRQPVETRRLALASVLPTP